MVDRQKLADVLPDYVAALGERLRDAGWGYLADSVSDVRILRALGRRRHVWPQHDLDPERSMGALPIQLPEEMVEIKIDRIVYIEIRGPSRFGTCSADSPQPPL